jgi:hypothetical protein
LIAVEQSLARLGQNEAVLLADQAEYDEPAHYALVAERFEMAGDRVEHLALVARKRLAGS